MATTTKYPIGLVLPIKKGNVGYFDQSFDSFTAYRMNIINLIRTNPGERRMNPTFGSRLWNIVFEPNDSFVKEKVEKIIKEDISKWVPGVSVSSVEVNYLPNSQGVDIYKLYIKVKYVVNVINQEDVVQIIVDKNKI